MADEWYESATWERAGITEAVYRSLPLITQSGLERQYNPKPVAQRRPVMRPLTPGELKSIAHLSGPAHTEAARKMQQTPPPEVS